MAQSIARKYTSVVRSTWPLLSSNKITARCMATGKPKKKVSGQLSQNSNRTLTYTEYDEGISITFGAESRQLPFLWLRDHCRSKDSYNHDTHQKIILPHRIDPNIKPRELKVEGNKLVVDWPEGLRSTYDPVWILENSFPGLEERIPKFVWDDAAISREQLSPFSFNEFMNNEEVLKEFLKTVLKYGFAVVEGVLDQTGKASVETTKK